MNQVSFVAPPLPYYMECGFSAYSPGEGHPDRKGLGVFDLLFVTEGVLHIGEDDTSWDLEEGQHLLLLPDRYHYAVKPCESPCHFFWLHFQTSEAWEVRDSTSDYTEVSRDFSTLQEPSGFTMSQSVITIPQHGKLPDPERIIGFWRQLRELSVSTRSIAFWEEQRIFMEMLKMLDMGWISGEKTKVHAVAETIEAYLKQHYQEELTNESIAEALHFHPNYLSRCMKAVFGCTPLAYLHVYRLEQAKLLLLKTQWPIAKISDYVGFQHAAYFSNCFRHRVGRSPAAFRKQFVRD